MKIQSITDIVTNSSTEVVMIVSRDAESILRELYNTIPGLERSFDENFEFRLGNEDDLSCYIDNYLAEYIGAHNCAEIFEYFVELKIQSRLSWKNEMDYDKTLSIIRKVESFFSDKDTHFKSFNDWLLNADREIGGAKCFKVIPKNSYAKEIAEKFNKLNELFYAEEVLC